MEISCPTPGLEPQLQRLWQLAFGDEESFIQDYFTQVYRPEYCRCVLADGQAAAALYWFDEEYQGRKLAYLYAVATHPGFRRRGLCRALMEDTHALLTQLHYDGALLLPAEDWLRPMYREMGYRDCCKVSQFSCAAGAPVPIRAIGQEEYAKLRRKYLPEGGVVQEGKNLELLSLLADTYAGADFVLAAARDEERLNCLELLGNPSSAPGILASLGYTAGTFRTPGSDIPFAMFRPLKEAFPVPTYFGLAFD
ncbi:MAG: GNAT family N-acetyltransferase [Faecousia sp.]